MTNNLQDAAEEIMPPMVEYAYGRTEVEGSQDQKHLTDEGFTQFYNPQSIMIDNEEFKTPDQKKTNHIAIAQMLSQELQKAQQRGKPVQWTVHGNGTEVLRSSLEMLPGKDLSLHTVMFMAPEGELDKTLRLMAKANMGVHGGVMKYSDDEISKSRLRNQYTKSDKVADALREFDNKILDQSADRIETEGKKATSDFAYNTTKTAAGIALGPILVGVKIAINTLAGNPYNHADNIEKYRNKLNSVFNVDNTDLNPHCHPHLSRNEFNKHVKDKSGGFGGSLKITFKTLLTKCTG